MTALEDHDVIVLPASPTLAPPIAQSTGSPGGYYQGPAGSRQTPVHQSCRARGSASYIRPVWLLGLRLAHRRSDNRTPVRRGRSPQSRSQVRAGRWLERATRTPNPRNLYRAIPKALVLMHGV